MLEVFPDNAPDGINKSLGFDQALTKKSLEFLPADKDVSLVLYLMLMLLPAQQGGIFQEGRGKQNSVRACGTGGGKVIFVLLEEIAILQVSFTSINVWEPSFERPLRGAFIVRSGGNEKSRNRCRSQRKKRSGFKDGSDNPLKVIPQVPNHGRVGRARSTKRSNNRWNSRSRSTCRGASRGAMVNTLIGSSASKLVFAIKRKILASIATSGGSSH